jgi:hypothetical protein
LTRSTWAADYIRKYGLKIEALATGDESPADGRARLDQAYAAYRPTTPGDVALVDQVIASSLAAERCRRLEARLRTEKLRTAELRWERQQEDDVAKYVFMLELNPYEAVPHLKRSAAGCRYLASEWRRLAAVLAALGTWFQHDRMTAIMLQGCSALFDDLYISETAFLTWFHSLGSQPRIQERDVELVQDRRLVPKPIQDRGEPVWPPDPAASRAYLAAIVARELPPVVALEEKLRVEYEEPARAAARELDQIENSKHEARLLRDLRSHERSVQLAHQALMKRKPARV